MHFIAIICGVIAGFLVWFVGSYGIVSSVIWAEEHYPQLVGSKQLRVGEGTACGLLFLLCLAVAIWVVTTLWNQTL